MPSQKVSRDDIIKISFDNEDPSLNDLLCPEQKNKSKTKIEFLSSQERELEDKLREED